MRIAVDISAAATENSQSARIREGMRMACLAYGFFLHGHRVTLCGNHENPFAKDPRYDSDPLNEIVGFPHGKYDLFVASERYDLKRLFFNPKFIVRFKTCNKADDEYDLARLKDADALVGYALSEALSSRDDVLVMPHGAHDRVLKSLWDKHQLGWYLKDDLERLRMWYGNGPREGAGFMGTLGYNRDVMAKGVHYARDILDPLQIEWTNKRPASEYLEALARWRVSLCFGGHLPSSYRFSESVLMGSVVAMKLWGVAYSEPVSEGNAIIVDSWGNPDVFSQGIQKLDELRAGADAAYRRGWSPKGQAQQILQKWFAGAN